MHAKLPTLDRAALRAQATNGNALLLALTVLLVGAAFCYGTLFIAAEALAIAAITVACVVSGYRLDVRSAADRTVRAEADARLAQQATDVKATLDALPTIADLAADARASLAALADAVSLGLACPVNCSGCAEDRRESEARSREFLAERAARHGHARTDA